MRPLWDAEVCFTVYFNYLSDGNGGQVSGPAVNIGGNAQGVENNVTWVEVVSSNRSCQQEVVANVRRGTDKEADSCDGVAAYTQSPADGSILSRLYRNRTVLGSTQDSDKESGIGDVIESRNTERLIDRWERVSATSSEAGSMGVVGGC